MTVSARATADDALLDQVAEFVDVGLLRAQSLIPAQGEGEVRRSGVAGAGAGAGGEGSTARC